MVYISGQLFVKLTTDEFLALEKGQVIEGKFIMITPPDMRLVEKEREKIASKSK